MVFGQILIQASYYGVSMFIGIFLLSILQKGFFKEFLKVKASFGKLILVKVTAVNRDYFRVGSVEDGFLLFKTANKKNEKRLSIPNQNVFYRCLGCAWVDVDEEKNAFTIRERTDFRAIDGYDAERNNNLFKRCLYRPSLEDKKNKIVMALLIMIMVLVIIVGFLVYKNGYSLEFLLEQISNISKGIIVNTANR